MRRRVILLAGTVWALAGPTALASDRLVRLLIGSGVSTGAGFALAGALATAISSPPGLPACRREPCGIPGLVASAQSFSSEDAAVAALLAGRIGAALVSAVVWNLADLSVADALAPFEPRLRTVAVLGNDDARTDKALVVPVGNAFLADQSARLIAAARTSGLAIRVPDVPATLRTPDGQRIVLPHELL